MSDYKSTRKQHLQCKFLPQKPRYTHRLAWLLFLFVVLMVLFVSLRQDFFPTSAQLALNSWPFSCFRYHHAQLGSTSFCRLHRRGSHMTPHQHLRDRVALWSQLILNQNKHQNTLLVNQLRLDKIFKMPPPRFITQTPRSVASPVTEKKPAFSLLVFVGPLPNLPPASRPHTWSPCPSLCPSLDHPAPHQKPLFSKPACQNFNHS